MTMSYLGNFQIFENTATLLRKLKNKYRLGKILTKYIPDETVIFRKQKETLKHRNKQITELKGCRVYEHVSCHFVHKNVLNIISYQGNVNKTTETLHTTARMSSFKVRRNPIAHQRLE